MEKVKPDIIAVGYDQENIFRKVHNLIKRKKLDMEVIQIGRFGPFGLGSSSEIKKRVIDGWKRPG